MKTVLEILKDARVLISDPEHWTQRMMARHADNGSCDIDDPQASKFCSLGALMKAAGVSVVGVETQRCYQAMMPKHSVSLTAINDNNTHEQVLKFWDDQIKRLETCT